uniref:IrrE N-terminal-like domain-containing protein n=1 Tax=Candidatus Kentrum sp. FM TaxID=2126340 RepID=A0A450T1T2_9GAMM|nr:MAG: protein of unknown function (DUF955) [Candidatus Kentron sp. FM]VFJ60306.1 MAG: protein of unknown function (DUF955) [Candidatus Kentron sp. FM]VFK12531.1 MAG: protein of unknown function (DUF955) [Candidatus Kentron sp. FM]
MKTHNHVQKSAQGLFEFLRETCNYETNIPIDVETIAKKLEITIDTKHIDAGDQTEIVGGIYFRDGAPIIHINPARNSYPPRKRFTIAHEIGHYILHSANSMREFTDDRTTMSRTESYWDTYEYEANNFAAELLMPTDAVFDACEKKINVYKELTGEDKITADLLIKILANQFVVSDKAMEYRLRRLRVIRN